MLTRIVNLYFLSMNIFLLEYNVSIYYNKCKMIKNSRLVIKVLLMMIAVTLVLGVTGLTYAYFSLEIDGKPKGITMSTGDLRLEYKDGALLSLNNALPGDFITKTFTVSNVGTKKTSYNLIWNNLINTIRNYDLHLDMKCKSYKNYNSNNQVEEGECNSFYKAVPYTETSIVKDIKRNNEIDAGITHVYNVTVTIKHPSIKLIYLRIFSRGVTVLTLFSISFFLSFFLKNIHLTHLSSNYHK